MPLRVGARVWRGGRGAHHFLTTSCGRLVLQVRRQERNSACLHMTSRSCCLSQPLRLCARRCTAGIAESHCRRLMGGARPPLTPLQLEPFASRNKFALHADEYLKLPLPHRPHVAQQLWAAALLRALANSQPECMIRIWPAGWLPAGQRAWGAERSASLGPTCTARTRGSEESEVSSSW